MAEVAHWPADGVKVYVVVPVTAVLMVAGFHVPVMAGELAELVGNAGGVELWHKRTDLGKDRCDLRINYNIHRGRSGALACRWSKSIRCSSRTGGVNGSRIPCSGDGRRIG